MGNGACDGMSRLVDNVHVAPRAVAFAFELGDGDVGGVDAPHGERA